MRPYYICSSLLSRHIPVIGRQNKPKLATPASPLLVTATGPPCVSSTKAHAPAPTFQTNRKKRCDKKGGENHDAMCLCYIDEMGRHSGGGTRQTQKRCSTVLNKMMHFVLWVKFPYTLLTVQLTRDKNNTTKGASDRKKQQRKNQLVAPTF